MRAFNGVAKQALEGKDITQSLLAAPSPIKEGSCTAVLCEDPPGCNDLLVFAGGQLEAQVDALRKGTLREVHHLKEEITSRLADGLISDASCAQQ